MSRAFTEGYLYGWRPDNPHAGSNNVRYADYVFKGDDVEVVDLKERAGDLKDTAKVSINNDHGKYTDETNKPIDHGDRVEFQTRRGRELRAFGTGAFGTGLFQPDLSIRWTGIVRNYSVTATGRGRMALDFDAEDFAYAIMSMRRVTNAWEEEQIVTGPGDGQGIINTVLSNECPELDLSELPAYDDTTTISVADKNVLEVIVELANRAGLILYARGTTVHLEKPSDISTKFDLQADDYTVYSFTSNDDSLFNRVRVEGGRSYELHEEQTQQDDWVTVTKDNRFTKRISTRKSEIDRIEIWTDPNRTDSGEDYVVRLQADDGGAPVDPSSTRSDIARKTLPYHFTAHGGWTTFIMPEHTLPSQQPWLIIESSGEVGQDIGIRGADGELAYRSHYPYPIRIRRDNVQSQDQYRLREDTLNDESVSDLVSARDMGDSYLRRNDEPEEELELPVDSDRLHDLQPGEVIRADFPEINASGRYVCIDRNVTWEGSIEEATVTIRDLTTL